jgi:hypothetical protein
MKQRTEAINPLAGDFYEFGHVAPKGLGYLPQLAQFFEDPGSDLSCQVALACGNGAGHGNQNVDKVRISDIA